MSAEVGVKPELWAVLNAPNPSNKMLPVSSKEKAEEFAAFYEQPIIGFVRESHYLHATKRIAELEADRNGMLQAFLAANMGEQISELGFKWLIADCGSRCLDCMIVSNLMMITPEGTRYDRFARNKLGISVAYQMLGEIEDASEMGQDEFIAWLDTQDTAGYPETGYTPAGAYMTEDGEAVRLWAFRPERA